MVTATPSLQHALLTQATRGIDAPFAVVDMGALAANAADIARRAAGLPVRLASKSIRSRPLLMRLLNDQAFRGVLAFTAPEAIWLASPTNDDPGIDDVVVAYPSVDRSAIATIATDPQLRRRITLMVDDLAQVELIQQAAQLADGGPVRVCLDVDASWRPRIPGAPHIGVRRSPLHSINEVRSLLTALIAKPEVTIVGLMFYEAQIAGVGDQIAGKAIKSAVISTMQRASATEISRRRPQIVEETRALLIRSGEAPLEFINAGGTGSLEMSRLDGAATELTAGSGFYAPTLFDSYSNFTLTPAAFFALPVVRKPAPDYVTVLGGGYVASGIADQSRLPTPWFPRNLQLDSLEGAGEVQTPLTGPGATSLRIGDLVWFRHAKAGELAERFAELLLVADGELTERVPTYRGQGMTFL